MNINKEIENNLLKFNMIEDTDVVVLGVSGGADSICLLYNLVKLKDKYNFNIIACHLNHSIRLSGTAERDAEFVRSECNKLGIEYRLKKVNIPQVAKELKLTEEEAGRIERYKFFNEVGNSVSPGRYKIATGANANDSVETMLMRLIRGTTVSGLASIPAVNGNIIRPMITVQRADIEKYIEENNLTHITDETNNETIFTRNKIRLELLPWIIENMNPSFIDTASNNITSYKEDSDFINEYVCKEYNYCVNKFDDFIEINRNALLDMHRSVSKRLILKCVKEIIGSESIGFNCIVLDNIINGLNNVGNRYIVDKNCIVVICKNHVKICKPDYSNKIKTNINFDTSNIKERGCIVVNDKIRVEYIESFDKDIINNGKEIYLPYDIYCNKVLSLRCRETGDRFIVINNEMTKTLSKEFNELHVQADERDNVLLIADGSNVLSIKGLKSTRFNNRRGSFLKITWL